MAEDNGLDPREYRRAIAQAVHRKGEIERLNAKVADLTAALEESQSKATQFEEALLRIDQEHEQLKRDVATNPSELQSKIDELQGQIRTRSHKDAFAKLAKGKVRDDAIDAAWDLSKWQAEGDEIDESKMGEAIASLLSTHKFLGSESAPAAPGGGVPTGSTPGQPRPAGPGMSRGGASAPAPSILEALRAQAQSNGRGDAFRVG